MERRPVESRLPFMFTLAVAGILGTSCVSPEMSDRPQDTQRECVQAAVAFSKLFLQKGGFPNFSKVEVKECTVATPPRMPNGQLRISSFAASAQVRVENCNIDVSVRSDGIDARAVNGKDIGEPESKKKDACVSCHSRANTCLAST